MSKDSIVTINGRPYDRATGMPISEAPKQDASVKAPEPTPKAPATTPARKPVAAKPVAKNARDIHGAAKAAPAPRVKPVPAPKPAGKPAAGTVHSTPQRSKTLHRRATKKPGLPARTKPSAGMDIARSASVSKFASHPQPKAATPTPKAAPKPNTPPKAHPVAAKATRKQRTTVSATPKQVKETAVAKALAPEPKPAKKKPAKKAAKTQAKKTNKKGFRWTRRNSVIAGIIIVLLGAGLIAYFNMPSITVGIASANAGISATYPQYTPDGYRLQQPVTYSDGEVGLTFTSNSGSGTYTVTQSRSSWDSSAVLENVVRAHSGDNYSVVQERGLTYYLYESNAAWVNGGILYVIDSSAPLSTDQVRRIATSL